MEKQMSGSCSTVKVECSEVGGPGLAQHGNGRRLFQISSRSGCPVDPILQSRSWVESSLLPPIKLGVVAMGDHGGQGLARIERAKQTWLRIGRALMIQSPGTSW